MGKRLTYWKRHSYATKSNQHASLRLLVGSWCTRRPGREPVGLNALLLSGKRIQGEKKIVKAVKIQTAKEKLAYKS